jgi:hypothetical protein
MGRIHRRRGFCGRDGVSRSSFFKGLLGSFRAGGNFWIARDGLGRDWVRGRACLCLVRLDCSSFFLKLLEAEEGSGDLAVEGDLVAEQEFVRADTFWGRSEGEDGAEGGGVSVDVTGGDVVVKVFFLHAPDPAATPISYGDGFHQHDLGCADGLMIGNQFVEQVEESAGVLLF